MRRFFVAFRKNKLNPFDAARASRLAEIMNNYGLNLDDLEDAHNLVKKLLASRNLQSSIIGEAVEFQRLKKGTGMSGKKLLEHIERKRQEACQSQKQIAETNKELGRVKSETKTVLAVFSKKQKQLSVYKTLSSIGLKKLEKVAQFTAELSH